MEPNKELELYKLVTNGGFECGWTGEKEFLIWVYLFELEDFVKRISGIFGDFMFEDGGVKIALLKDYVCIDLCTMLCDYDIDFENVFPKNEFKH